MSYKDYPSQEDYGRRGYVVLRAMDTSRRDPDTGSMVIDHANYVIVRDCRFCKQEARVTVPAQGLWDWEHGAFAQNAFPNMSADQREMVMTGTHPECWDRFMSDPEDEEEE
jgi:hypothetical protein